MRNLLAFLAALVLTLIAVGWYLDWYRIRATPAPSGQRSITVDFNTQKIGEDLRKAEHQIQQKLAEKIDKAQNAEKPRPETSPVTNIPTFEFETAPGQDR